MFRHHAGDDHIDQLKFMHDEGFRALEDNGMGGREVSLQEKIAAELDLLGMEMGVFVAHTSWGGVSFVVGRFRGEGGDRGGHAQGGRDRRAG